MKNILIIKCANAKVIDNLIKYINQEEKEAKIFILIQRGLSKDFSKKYPDIKCIQKEDGFFIYKTFVKNGTLRSELNDIKFDKIYIPSSYIKFDGCDEIFLISAKINAKKYILFNSLGEVQEVKLNKAILKFERYLRYLIYIIKATAAYMLAAICYTVYLPYFKIKGMLNKIKGEIK